MIFDAVRETSIWVILVSLIFVIVMLKLVLRMDDFISSRRFAQKYPAAKMMDELSAKGMGDLKLTMEIIERLENAEDINAEVTKMRDEFGLGKR